MKIIVDTNVLISAILRSGKPKIAIIHILDSLEYEWIGSLDIIEEYKNVLKRPKFKLSEKMIYEWLEIFEKAIKLIDVNINIDFARDRKDAKFLACAMASGANYLITGDRDFEEVTELITTKIITVAEFLEIIGINEN